MSAHTANRTVPNRPYEQEQNSVSGTYHVLAGSVQELIGAQAENDLQDTENHLQELLVWNPDPDINSLGEVVEDAVRKGWISVEVAREILRPAREMLASIRRERQSNQRERGHERVATGSLDLHAKVYAVQPERQGLGVKRAAVLLRPHLRVIRDELAKGPGEQRDGIALIHASRRADHVIRELPVATLRGKSMRNALNGSNPTRTGLHEVLLSLLTDDAEASDA
jgi:hypothetical protein